MTTADDAPSRTSTPAPDQPASISVAEANATLTAPGQLFEMEDRDIRGISTRTWKNAPETLRTILDLSLGHGDKTFLVYEDERTSFAEHYRIACTLAHRLRDEFSITPGDRVAIAMRNLPEWVMAFWAISLTGAIVVPLNAWWSGEELRYGLEDSGSKIAFVDTQRAEAIRPFLGGLSGLHRPDCGRRAPYGEPRHGGSGAADSGTAATVRIATDGSAPVTEWPFALALGDVDANASPPDVTIDPEDDATIFYTSGTTGRPKGAVGTHRNICTNLMSLFFINTRAQLRFGKSLVDPSAKVAERNPLVSAALPRHGLSLRHGGEHRRRREDRHDAPLRSRASARADRPGADHHLRRSAGHGHAGARLPPLRPVRHLVHPQRVLRRLPLHHRTSSGAYARPGPSGNRPTATASRRRRRSPP